MDLDTLAKKLTSTRVTRVEGRSVAGSLYLSAIALDDGTVLRFHWAAGAADEVGVRIYRPVATSRRSFRIC